MNVLNRLVLIILLVALAGAAISVVALTWTIPVETIDVLDEGVDWLEESYGDPEKIMVSTGALLVALVAVVFLMLELAPRSNPEVKVTDLQGGEAYLSTAAIGQRVEEAVSRVPNVSDVKASVGAKGKGVTVTLDLHVDPQANVAVVTDEAIRTTRDVLTNQVHVAMVEPPLAHLHYREMNLTRGAPRRQPMAFGPTGPIPATAAAGASMAPPPLPERFFATQPPPPPLSPPLPERRFEPAASAPVPMPPPPSPPPPEQPRPEASAATPSTPPEPEPERPRATLPPSPIDAERVGTLPPELQPGERVVDEYGHPIAPEPQGTSNGGPARPDDDRPASI